MSIKEKTYWELAIEVNPVCTEVLCDIIQSEFECEGIITAEEKYKNLELVETSENVVKAYIVAETVNISELQQFFREKRQELIERKVFSEDIGSWDITVTKQEIVDWSKKWKEHWKPTKISERIVICPSWEKYEGKEIIVTLDPGNAFGTGIHATTQLCVRACEKYMESGNSVADIGCGSGILGICALKLGASHVDSVDTDETVIETARSNAKLNNENKINFQNASSDVLPLASYDFVFANILHNVLAEIMPDLKRIMKEGAKIVLSGILEGKEPVVIEALNKAGLSIVEEMHQKEWIAFVGTKESVK